VPTSLDCKSICACAITQLALIQYQLAHLHKCFHCDGRPQLTAIVVCIVTSGSFIWCMQAPVQDNFDNRAESMLHKSRTSASRFIITIVSCLLALTESCKLNYCSVVQLVLLMQKPPKHKGRAKAHHPVKPTDDQEYKQPKQRRGAKHQRAKPAEGRPKRGPGRPRKSAPSGPTNLRAQKSGRQKSNTQPPKRMQRAATVNSSDNEDDYENYSSTDTEVCTDMYCVAGNEVLL